MGDDCSAVLQHGMADSSRAVSLLQGAGGGRTAKALGEWPDGSGGEFRKVSPEFVRPVRGPCIAGAFLI